MLVLSMINISIELEHRQKINWSCRNVAQKSGLQTFHTSGIHLYNLLDSDHKSNNNYHSFQELFLKTVKATNNK